MEAALNGQYGQINLGTVKFTIGRASNNQLVVNDPQVSGYHAEIRPEGQGYSLIDFGSTNGTFVNEYRLTPNVPRSLHPNDRLRFGQNRSNPDTMFTYQVSGTVPVEPTRLGSPSVPSKSSSPQPRYQPPPPPVQSVSPPLFEEKRGPAKPRPRIRDIIAGQANYTPPAGMSEQEIANIWAPLAQVSGEEYYRSMKEGEAIGKAFGLKSKKQLQKIVPGSYQYASIVLSFVLAFRHLEREMVAYYDTAHGSVIEVKLPVDVLAYAGTLSIEFIDESPSRILINGATEIAGQMFDWGKGKRALEDVFETAAHYLDRMTS